MSLWDKIAGSKILGNCAEIRREASHGLDVRNKALVARDALTMRALCYHSDRVMAVKDHLVLLDCHETNSSVALTNDVASLNYG